MYDVSRVACLHPVCILLDSRSEGGILVQLVACGSGPSAAEKEGIRDALSKSASGCGTAAAQCFTELTPLQLLGHGRCSQCFLGGRQRHDRSLRCAS